MLRRLPRFVPSAVLVAVACAATLIAGCAPRADIRSAEQIGDIVPPTFELVPGRTSIERFDPPGAGGGLAMTIGTLAHNPNDFGIRLDGATYTVFLEGKQVVKGAIAPEVYLEPGATAPVDFVIATELRGSTDLLRAVVRAFADRPLPFRVEGTLRFRSASHAFETRSRVLVEGATLARQTVQAPLLRLNENDSRAFLLQSDVPVVQVVLQAANPGDIGYFLHGKDLTLSLGGWPIAVADMPPVPLAAGQASRIDLLFYPNVDEVTDEARAVLQAALDGYATLLRLEGELSMDVLGVDSFPVPAGWSVTGFVH